MCPEFQLCFFKQYDVVHVGIYNYECVCLYCIDESSHDKVDTISDEPSETVSEDMKVVKATGSPAPPGDNKAVEKSEARSVKPTSELVQDGITDVTVNSRLLNEEVNKMSSLSATMWLGSQSGR